MMVHLVYLAMGFLLGIILKCEIDNRVRLRRIERRVVYLRTRASKQLKQYDDILNSIKKINESLMCLQNSQKKEVH